MDDNLNQCYSWSSADFLWNETDYSWSKVCDPVPNQKCFTWSEADFLWNLNDFTWNEVCVLIKIITPLGGAPLEDINRLTEKEKETLITLVLRIKGETIKQTKKKKRYKVTAKDIDLVVTKFINEINISLGDK